MPGLAPDEMAVVAGPQLASSDSWEVTFHGVGTHGAKPHLGRDAMTAAGAFPHRDPHHRGPPRRSAAAGRGQRLRHYRRAISAALNVIPDDVRIGGTARAYSAEVRDQLEAEIGQLATGVAGMFGIRASYGFERRIAAGGQRCRRNGRSALRPQQP